MQIRSKLGPLPEGIAVAARRSGRHILVIISEDAYRRECQRREGKLMACTLEAINRLLEGPEDEFGPVELPEAKPALAS